MFHLLWLIPVLPLAGFLVLALAGSRLPRKLAATIGVGSVVAAAVLVYMMAAEFLASAPPPSGYAEVVWTWIPIDGFGPTISFRFDALSLVMTLVITTVASLILLYSTEFMQGDEGYSRYFAYMNLFVASMLVLILADDLLFLYLGWEGVGLCSYLLIGFWYQNPANVRAARKAFLITRIGDTALVVGLLLLFTALGTLQIPELLARAARQWPVGSGAAGAAAALLLVGAIGKSAQIPLHTWLPDAMAGPTPVSALIHAATMVIAGVYLIARMHVLFELAPIVQTLVALVGTVTLLLAACAALTQRDIKRVLAYSTISQIGYMFLALGVGAWWAAIFHFMMHAFFKSLLFLGAGVVILGLDRQHDMFRMGGLRKAMPGTFLAFLAGASSLAALPLITAGFYSKDAILQGAWGSPVGHKLFWVGGLLGAVLTAMYSFRMVFLTFFGPLRQQPKHKPGIRIGLPMAVLAVLSIVAGFLNVPPALGNKPLLADFLRGVLPSARELAVSSGTDALLVLSASLASLVGLLLAWVFFGPTLQLSRRTRKLYLGQILDFLWFYGWGFDLVYDAILAPIYVKVARLLGPDPLTRYTRFIARICLQMNELLGSSQTGQIRWYATGIAIGAVIYLAIVVLL